MPLMQREFVTVSLVRNVFTQGLRLMRVRDTPGQQYIYLIIALRWAVVVKVQFWHGLSSLRYRYRYLVGIERFARPVAVWYTAAEYLGESFAHLLCYLYDHDFEVDAFDAEHGSEDISCRRCGFGVHAQF